MASPTSRPSFRLFKRKGKGVFFARSRAGGTEVEFSCQSTDRIQARKFAEAELARRRAPAAPATARKPAAAAPAKRRGRPPGSKNRAKESTKDEPSAMAPAPAPAASTSSPAPSSRPPAPQAPPARDQAIANKLRLLGAAAGVSPLYTTPLPAAPSSPAPADDDDEEPYDDDEDRFHPPGAVEPDDVIPPAAAGGAGDDQEDEDDQEATELFADTIATGIVTGTVALVTRRLRTRTPPERPGEPDEKCVDWYTRGLSYRLRKLTGRGSMGPNAMLAVGAAGVILSMLLNSEPIGAQPSSPYRAPSSPAPAPPAAPPDPEPPHGSNGVTGGSLGRFR